MRIPLSILPKFGSNVWRLLGLWLGLVFCLRYVFVASDRRKWYSDFPQSARVEVNFFLLLLAYFFSSCIDRLAFVRKYYTPLLILWQRDMVYLGPMNIISKTDDLLKVGRVFLVPCYERSVHSTNWRSIYTYGEPWHATI